MTDYTIEVNTQNWYCECCGSGTHFDITLFDKDKRLWGTSCNDQFGGTYRDGDDEFIPLSGGYEVVVNSMAAALKALGHTVTLRLNIDETDPFYEDDDE
jgi:hypothetical protein